MDVITIAPGVGALLAMRVLFPRWGYARGLALVLGVAAAACVVEGLVTTSAPLLSAAGVVALSWGVYPSITALLTPDESAQSQGHLQSALYALTTLGSVVGLYGYLWLYETSSPSGAAAANSAAMDADLSFSAIWWASAALLAVSVVAVVAAGEGSTAGHVLRDPPAATPAAARAADDSAPKPRIA